ncbi:hypothetical protein EMCRGX_G008869 [Ephydatia muelleri]
MSLRATTNLMRVKHNYISTQGPNATVYIGSNHPKQALYFCHVQSNGSEVAVGYATIKPQGFLIPIGPTEFTYQYGDTIVLGVNISSYYYLESFIQSLQWYKDGNPLPVNCSSDMRVYTNTMGTRLTIQRAGRSDEGQYTVKINNILGANNSVECYQNLLSLLEGHYATHSPVTFTVSPSLIQVPPQVSLQAVPSHPSHNSPVIVITCAALNGTPDVHNITLIKNGSVLETVVGGNTLTYTVTWSGLGQYVCEVDSLYSTDQETFVLKESAMARLKLMSNENMIHLCQNEQFYVQNMTTQLRYLTETLCSCTLSKDTFTQANVTCPSNNEPWSAVVSVWVQYASNDGLVTASDLISMIHNWLLDSTCACVAIEGSTLQLSRGCCTNGTNLQDTSAQLVVGTIGGFVGGILLTICLGACVILSIAKVGKLGNSVNRRNPVKDGGGIGGSGSGGDRRAPNFEMQNMSDIGMEENAAYETVRYGL